MQLSTCRFTLIHVAVAGCIHPFLGWCTFLRVDECHGPAPHARFMHCVVTVSGGVSVLKTPELVHGSGGKQMLYLKNRFAPWTWTGFHSPQHLPMLRVPLANASPQMPPDSASTAYRDTCGARSPVQDLTNENHKRELAVRFRVQRP